MAVGDEGGVDGVIELAAVEPHSHAVGAGPETVYSLSKNAVISRPEKWSLCGPATARKTAPAD